MFVSHNTEGSHNDKLVFYIFRMQAYSLPLSMRGKLICQLMGPCLLFIQSLSLLSSTLPCWFCFSNDDEKTMSDDKDQRRVSLEAKGRRHPHTPMMIRQISLSLATWLCTNQSFLCSHASIHSLEIYLSWLDRQRGRERSTGRWSVDSSWERHTNWVRSRPSQVVQFV